MKIAINILFLEPGRVGGTEIISTCFLKELDKQFATNNQVDVYCTKSFTQKYQYQNINLKPIINSAKNKIKRILIEIIILPFYLLCNKSDLLHSLGYTSPPITPCPKITVIHDLQYQPHPQTVPILTRLAYRLLLPLVIVTNNQIITATDAIKKQIQDNFPLLTKLTPIKKISWGTPLPSQDKTPLKKRDPIIFTPSATHPHKNLKNLVQAYTLLIQDKEFKHYKLIISGSQGKAQNEIKNIIKKNNLDNRVNFLGWVNYAKVIKIMKTARLCALPSFYEGFGLPSLEALACHTPIAAAQNNTFPEILQDAAVYFDPQEPKDICKALEKLISSDKLSSQKTKKGDKIIKQFTWKKHLSQIENLYHHYAK